MTARCPTCGHLPSGRPGKLSEDDVRAIRASTEKHEVLADRYGIARPGISMIKTRKSYAWVTNEPQT